MKSDKGVSIADPMAWQYGESERPEQKTSQKRRHREWAHGEERQEDS